MTTGVNSKMKCEYEETWLIGRYLKNIAVQQVKLKQYIGLTIA